MSRYDAGARRRARERAVQFLFGMEFTGKDAMPDRNDFWEAFPSKASVRRYAETVIDGVITHRGALDEAIDAALNTWAPDRVGPVERNVLRVAAYEMAFAEDVPRKVAINEAIEVVKVLGGDESPRFINGVLDRIDVSPVSGQGSETE